MVERKGNLVVGGIFKACRPAEFPKRPKEPEEIFSSPLDRDQLRELGLCFPNDFDYWQKFRSPETIKLEMAEDPLIDLKEPSLFRDFLLWPPVKRMGDWGRREDYPTTISLDDKHGISQLGLCRETNPFIPTPTTRGWHEFAVAYGAVAVSARLAREQREEFLATTVEYRSCPSDEEHIAQMVGLAAAFGFLHDLHPPGGDGMKKATGLDEAEMFKVAMADPEMFSIFCQICRKYNLGEPERVRDWAFAMVERRDDGLIGRLVHGQSKELADLDFITYSLGDTALGLIFLVDSYYDQETKRNDPFSPDQFLARLSLKLQYPELYDPYRHELFDFQAFNPLLSLRLEQGKIVFTDPERLLNLINLSSVLHQHHYYNPRMTGAQLALIDEFTRHPDFYPSAEEISRMSLPELKERLRGTPAGLLFSRRFHQSVWRSWGPLDKESAEEARKEGCLVGHFPVNLRLQTLVKDEKTGGIMTIREWADRYKNGMGERLAEVEERYQGSLVFRLKERLEEMLWPRPTDPFTPDYLAFLQGELC